MNRNIKYSLIIALLVGFYFYQKNQIILKPQLDESDIPNSVSVKEVSSVQFSEKTNVMPPYIGPVVKVVFNYNYIPSVQNGVLVKHDTYSLSYVEAHEQAEWVAYKLNKDYIEGSAKRSKSFRYDQQVLTFSANSKDYTHSGYDRGHLLPAADRKNSKSNMRETFLMSNVSPQDPNLNRKAWKELEEAIRDNIYRYDSLYIVTGPVFSENSKTIGENEVTVPSHFYKIVLSYGQYPCTVSYLFPNESVKHVSEDYIVSIDEIEQLTGVNFFYNFPDSIQDKMEESKGCLRL